jgi:hypothetical protein
MLAVEKIWGSAPAAARLPRNIFGKMMQGDAHV